jgi:hypothetical protein
MRGRALMLAAAVALAAAIAGARCGGKTSTAPTPAQPDPLPGTVPPPTQPPPSPPQTLVGAGDIAWCQYAGAEQTARLVQGIGGQVFTAGDNAYLDGSLQNFRDCYEPTWGRFKDRTRPVAGNHEFDTDRSGSGYYSYFGASASPATQGYYSYDLGDWHIVALNSAMPMDTGSAQLRWLEADLVANPRRCTAAIWHHPLFTSGPNGPQTFTRAAWRVLYDANADLIVNGHDHLYERFAPQDADGRRDPARGLRQFTVGTGGAQLYALATLSPNSERQIVNTWGVIRFTLSSGSYEWQFVPVAGGAPDSGRADCH